MHAPRLIFGLVMAVASLAARADAGEARYDDLFAQTSNVTREEVKRELAAAQARGVHSIGERYFVWDSMPAPTRSRAEVVAETLEAARLGVLFPNDSGVPVLTAEQRAQIMAAGREAARLLADSQRKPQS